MARTPDGTAVTVADSPAPLRKFCFVISPIGDPDTPIRQRADGVLTAIIRPALEPLGYRVERADHDKAPGLITDKVITKIVEADLVVADLTGLNANVLYELAIRHCADKAFIQMMEVGDELPFDIHDVNTVFFDATLAGWSQAVKRLQEAEAAVAGGQVVGNPVSRTLQFRAFAAAAKPGDQGAFLIQAIGLIREDITDLRRAVDDRARLKQPPEAVRRTTWEERMAVDPSYWGAKNILITEEAVNRRLDAIGASIEILSTTSKSVILLLRHKDGRWNHAIGWSSDYPVPPGKEAADRILDSLQPLLRRLKLSSEPSPPELEKETTD